MKYLEEIRQGWKNLNSSSEIDTFCESDKFTKLVMFTGATTALTCLSMSAGLPASICMAAIASASVKYGFNKVDHRISLPVARAADNAIVKVENFAKTTNRQLTMFGRHLKNGHNVMDSLDKAVNEDGIMARLQAAYF